MTVSNVMRGRTGRASNATRERVMEAVQEYNYIPVRPALQNRHVEMRVIGVVLDHSAEHWHPLDAEIFDGVRAGAVQHGYDLLLHLRSKPDWVREREEVWLLDRRSDAFIFVNSRKASENFLILEKLVAYGVPAATCYGGAVPPGIASIRPDNARAVELALDCLQAHGHQRIGMLAAKSDVLDARERTQSFENLMRERKLVRKPVVFEGIWAEPAECESDARQMLALVKSHKLTAVFCANSGQAAALQTVARAAGLKLPRDLSVIGVDETGDCAERGLCTIAHSFSAAGREAFRAVLRMIGGEDSSNCSARVDVALIERNSIGRAPTA
jgi:LacI family transcriptional regulator